ncbi:hypothetical protein LINPERPRIM_LOCUS11874, partial [Linum perenne]
LVSVVIAFADLHRVQGWSHSVLFSLPLCFKLYINSTDFLCQVLKANRDGATTTEIHRP